MRLWSFRVARSLAAGLLAGLAASSSAAQTGPDLPLVSVAPTSAARGPLVLILSGDGDWGAFPQALARRAAELGSPVLGLKSRSYLRTPRTPDQASSDLAGAVRRALVDGDRDDLVVVGYSRGAEMAPFVIDRWPAELRARVRGLALVGAGEWASFRFHLIDLVKSVHRPEDLPLRPELDRLRDLRVVCVYGVEEGPGLCADPLPGMRVRTHAGGHRVAGDDAEVSRMVLAELGIGG